MHFASIARHVLIVVPFCGLVASGFELAIPPAFADETSSLNSTVAEVVVQRAGKECFSSLVHGSGYLMPRGIAVVMFNAPGYRISEIKAKVGDTVARGDVVAQATPLTPPPPGAPTDILIKTPASGSIIQTAAFEGEVTSQRSEPLFRVAVDAEIEAAVNVPSVHVAELETGQVAHMTIRNGPNISGHIRLTPVTVDPANQMGETRITFDSDQHLGPGWFVQAEIETRQSCNIGVPHFALRRTSVGMQVEIVENDIVVTRAVQVGLANDIDTEVTSGLREGDLVVSNIGSSLRDGDRVRPIFSDQQDAR